MLDLQVKYAGLTLPSPVIAGSSGLSRNLETVKALAAAGAGAIVLPSLFEEQIEREIATLETESAYTEGQEMLEYFQKQHALEEYLGMIKRTKEAVEIPVIASINCYRAGSWMEFAHRIATAGADALELNIFYLTSNPDITDNEIRNNYLTIARQIVKEIDIPVILKVSSSFTNLTGIMRELSFTGIDGLVLFNRFVRPDIDVERLEMRTAEVISSVSDMSASLRWIGILSDKVDCDLCASSGIKNGEDVIKMLLAGANAVQMVNALYLEGASAVSSALAYIRKWMERHNFSDIEEFRGRLSQDSLTDATLYERVQFIKYFSEYKK
ncbi:MAG: dihydroorotate dehydrogenase-like protein [Candidatus Cloacimonetes bacterium]|nr:dihydroorotate dehydrogenase-like protein [Candidatus Cloacimonadota bacterium]